MEAAETACWDMSSIEFGKQKKKQQKSLMMMMMTFAYIFY
jgi:hypothetical protein